MIDMKKTCVKCWSCGYLVYAETNMCPECGAKLENHPDTNEDGIKG